MAWKNLTFVLIPHSQSNVKQIRVHRYVLMGAAFFLLLAIGTMIFYIIGFQKKSFLLSDSREINRQNIILEKTAANFDFTLTALSTKVDSIEQMAEVIRLEAGISNHDLNLINGPSVQLAESGVDMPLNRVLQYINNIERRSYAFEQNFNSLNAICLNNVDFLKCLPSIRPADGTLTKEFQFLQQTDNYSIAETSRSGVDITNVEGTSILATADGVVSKVDVSNELGRYIEINHGNGYKTRYTHLLQKGITVKAGSKVSRGDVIGLMGRTGSSIKAVAPHVMYSVEHNGTFVDPTDYFLVTETSPGISVETSSAQMQ